MNQDEYMKKRLDDQINWYDNKSLFCQKRFKLIRALEITFAALVPFLSTIPGSSGMLKIIIAALGCAIVILTGINAMNKYQELWLSYRTTAETLKHHKYVFETQCKPYDYRDAFNQFMEKVKSTISPSYLSLNMFNIK